MKVRIILVLGIAVFASILVIRAVSSGVAHLIVVEANYLGEDLWTISATILHEDTGLEHYADRWDVISPSGIVIGSRKLLHPHVNEQPFTRLLPNLHIRQISTKCESELLTAFTGKMKLNLFCN